MPINTPKVIAGGLAAGVVLNVIDYLANGVFLAEQMAADANAFKPGLGDAMAQMSGGQIAAYVIMDFVIGLLLVWTYAGFRPRFGPGPKTASYVSLVFFTFGMIVAVGYMHMGITSTNLWLKYAGVMLVNLVLASIVGARVYSEEGSSV